MVCCCSITKSSLTLWTSACQTPLSSSIFWSLLKLMSIESVILFYHLILCRPLFLLPSIFPSIRVFSISVSSLHQVAKVLELQLHISPSNEYSGLVPFGIRWYWCSSLCFVQLQVEISTKLIQKLGYHEISLKGIQTENSTMVKRRRDESGLSCSLCSATKGLWLCDTHPHTHMDTLFSFFFFD